MKTNELIVKMLTDLASEVKEVRKDISDLRVGHETLNQRVKDEAKNQSRSYARVYGAITAAISIISCAIAYAKK